MSLKNFFNPKSVAVVGASSDPKKVGFAIMTNLLRNKDRKIFPINISEKEILGVKVFSSILEINEKIDLAIIAVRADLVPKILEEVSSEKIKSVIIISSGFKEMGGAGIQLEEQIVEIAKRGEIDILGPNCLGIINMQEDFNSSFSSDNPLSGDISFLSQSGALGTSILDKAFSEGIGFSRFISLGNEAGLNEMDFLRFLGEDDKTKSILVYLEKISDGSNFIKLAKKITKIKPIVVLKAGRSEHGARAVSSHTGSLASDDAVFSSACRQSGVIVVNSISDFFNMAKLFQMNILKPLQRATILTNGGGPSAVATDLVDMSHSLTLSMVSDTAKEKLQKVLPPMASILNPIDILGDALSDRFENSLEILVKEKYSDVILLLVTPQMMTEMRKTAELVKKYQSQKPIIPIFLGGIQILPALEFLRENKMINFHFPVDAISALDYLASGLPKFLSLEHIKIDLDKKSQSDMMNFESTTELLADYDITLSGVFVKEKFEISPILKRLKFNNFVMKAFSPQIVHKTDSGAVVLNIKDTGEAEKAWDDIKNKNPNVKIEGILIQPKVEGKEVIIGMKYDRVFGPVILFGLGGIFAEAIKDTSLRVGLVTKEEALKMIKELKGIKILQGMRGEKPIDFDALAEIIVNISKLAMDHPEIKEIDLNPVMVTEKSAIVVDARIMI